MFYFYTQSVAVTQHEQFKVKCLKVLKKILTSNFTRFMDPNTNEETPFEAGERFLVALYGGDHHDPTLHKPRYIDWDCLQNIFQPRFNCTSCCYCFCCWQTALGGWKSLSNGLISVTTLLPPPPDKVLRKVACQCKKNWTGEQDYSAQKIALSVRANAIASILKSWTMRTLTFAKQHMYSQNNTAPVQWQLKVRLYS